MSGPGNPWSDPATPTEPGTPYTGPPATDPPPVAGHGPAYGPPGYGPPGYGPAYGPYGYPAPSQGVPRGPRRPGQVIAAAVLAFVQAALVLAASLYVSILGVAASALSEQDPSLRAGEAHALGTEAVVVAIVQVASAIALIVGGVMVLNSRRRPAVIVLVAGLAVQVLLSSYWAVRIVAVFGDIPGPDPTGTVRAFAAAFAAGPLVGLGLLAFGPARAWFRAPEGGRAAR